MRDWLFNLHGLCYEEIFFQIILLVYRFLTINIWKHVYFYLTNCYIQELNYFFLLHFIVLFVFYSLESLHTRYGKITRHCKKHPSNSVPIHICAGYKSIHKFSSHGYYRCYCFRHGFLHQRMNANGSDTKWFIFLEQ